MTNRDASLADTAERAMLRDTVRRMFRSNPTSLQAAETGIFGLLTPEESGGAGWLPVEACLVAAEAGRALASLPWSDNLIAAAALAYDQHWEEVRLALLRGILRGAVARPARLERPNRTMALTGVVSVAGDRKPDVLVVLDERLGALALDCRGHRATFSPSSGFDTTRSGGTLTLASLPARTIEGRDVRTLSDAATLVSCADSLGALTATAELVREHLSARTAFERPIASFQAIQHRLAELAVLEAACVALLRRAANSLASGATHASSVVGAAHLYFARHVTAALDDCIQLSGGIGFTWEYPPHHAMRRALTNTTAIRSAGRSVECIDFSEISGPPREADRFRVHVRAVIHEHMPYPSREGHRAPTSPEAESALRGWYRTMYENGLLGASWPEEWGGDPGYHPLRDLIVTEELIWARAPRPIDQVQLASHVLLRFGTDEQKSRYLPKIRTAEHIWCQLFSEPDCGSDLAGIKARAERQTDGSWCLSGQKTWTTDAHWAQMGLGLLRTSDSDRRNSGVTAFLIPMDSRGLEVRPKLTMGGASEFNDVFLDGVELDEGKLLGTEGEGWAVAMSGLEMERFGVGGNVLMLDLLLKDLLDVAGAVSDGRGTLSADIRRDIVSLISEAQAARSFIADHVDRALADAEAPTDASIAKILYTETYHRIARYGSEFVVEHDPIPISVEPQAARLKDAWLWSRALTISGGTSEVMRNIIAKRRLLLPQ